MSQSHLEPTDMHKIRIMEGEEFKQRGKEMIDYIVQYINTIGSRSVTPVITAGYLAKLLPSQAPHEPEAWESIMEDVESKIMPGITHWVHPRFHGYFPAGNSYPSILGDMLSDAIGSIGFTWASSPACTELEIIVLDWLGRAIGLPDAFLATGEGRRGGGVIQSSASECILDAMLAARHQAIRYLKCKGPKAAEESSFLPLLVAYCSKEAHSSVEKAALLSLVKLRILEPDENNSLRGETLRKAIHEDKKQGLVPFFVSATLGTTSCCSFDNLVEIGPICKQEETIWMHVDAAYAGSAFMCPEFRPLMAGIEYADSFNTNTNKWLLVNFDCSALWVRNKIKFTKAFIVNALYLDDAYEDEREGLIIDYRHWGIPLSRRFRALKLWFVMRSYGIKGLQNYLRNHCKLAKLFESLVSKDERFEIMNDVKMGLVCFRLIGHNDLTKNLVEIINDSGKLFMILAEIKNNYIIRFCVDYRYASQADIEYAWRVIETLATDVLSNYSRNRFEDPILPNQRKLSGPFRFTKKVSRELYNRLMSKPILRDGTTPILVPDDE